MRKAILAFLTFSLLLDVSLAQQKSLPARTANPAAPPAASGAPPAQAPEVAQSQPATRRRSYEREVIPRRHRAAISKQEVAFMAAIAGTSMGIGALAGGAKGLAIGSIVGGWGAYVGHRIWKHVK